jgi:hypothetical protein
MLQAETISTQNHAWGPPEWPPLQLQRLTESLERPAKAKSRRSGTTAESVQAPTHLRRLLESLGYRSVVSPAPRRSDRTASGGPVAYSPPPTDAAFKIARVAEPSPEDKLAAELQSYLDLPHGWDGYDGVPASLDAITDAFLFLDMRPADIPLPYPEIGPDGEVGVYWRTVTIFAEISFHGDGEYSYYARYAPDGGEPVEEGRDGCSLSAESWDAGLLQVLNRLAN